MGTVVIKSIDRELVQKAVETYADGLRKAYPEIELIIWFGSWISGLPSPGSDVDLCIVVSRSDKPCRDRGAEYLPLGFPVGIDLFVYTREEFERLSPGWREALAGGTNL